MSCVFLCNPSGVVDNPWGRFLPGFGPTRGPQSTDSAPGNDTMATRFADVDEQRIVITFGPPALAGMRPPYRKPLCLWELDHIVLPNGIPFLQGCRACGKEGARGRLPWRHACFPYPLALAGRRFRFASLRLQGNAVRFRFPLALAGSCHPFPAKRNDGAVSLTPTL